MTYLCPLGNHTQCIKFNAIHLLNFVRAKSWGYRNSFFTGFYNFYCSSVYYRVDRRGDGVGDRPNTLHLYIIFFNTSTFPTKYIFHTTLLLGCRPIASSNCFKLKSNSIFWISKSINNIVSQFPLWLAGPVLDERLVPSFARSRCAQASKPLHPSQPSSPEYPPLTLTGAPITPQQPTPPPAVTFCPPILHTYTSTPPQKIAAGIFSFSRACFGDEPRMIGGPGSITSWVPGKLPADKETNFWFATFQRLAAAAWE